MFEDDPKIMSDAFMEHVRRMVEEDANRTTMVRPASSMPAMKEVTIEPVSDPNYPSGENDNE
jgi:hypothetical protein